MIGLAWTRAAAALFLTMTQALLQPSDGSAASLSSAITETIVYPTLTADSTKPAPTLQMTFQHNGSFRIAWRVAEPEAAAGYFTKDNLYVFQADGRTQALLPTGATLPAGKIEDTRPYHPTTIDRTPLPSNAALRADTLQRDEAGNRYYQEENGSWVSIDPSGKSRYRLVLGDPEATCKVAPSGDAVCASPAIGLLGIRHNNNAPRLVIDGVERIYAIPPEIRNGVTYVPLRGVFEALQAEVSWDNTTQTVTAIRGKQTIRMTVGRTDATVNGRKSVMPAPALMEKGRTLIPLRFVGETLGAYVIWEGPTRTIQIVKPG